ncbi:hypothetical protein GMI69_00705 [Eggerthellaceae bacterium zg-887]|uniref:N-acetylmuramoyl-L-alanine amidase family protein n=1 Tax=Xiamenia xianingshaonis TaxID=2682776 RepID=UPI00140A0111|nr:N-acetylmuramoyl-L-alanine amidase family protein [Xiamenia xianingshaonis]NHM15196.1 hypothetical protein [Xiamenia xianingshaonis]
MSKPILSKKTYRGRGGRVLGLILSGTLAFGMVPAAALSQAALDATFAHAEALPGTNGTLDGWTAGNVASNLDVASPGDWSSGSAVYSGAAHEFALADLDVTATVEEGGSEGLDWAVSPSSPGTSYVAKLDTDCFTVVSLTHTSPDGWPQTDLTGKISSYLSSGMLRLTDAGTYRVGIGVAGIANAPGLDEVATTITIAPFDISNSNCTVEADNEHVSRFPSNPSLYDVPNPVVKLQDGTTLEQHVDYAISHLEPGFSSGGVTPWSFSVLGLGNYTGTNDQGSFNVCDKSLDDATTALAAPNDPIFYDGAEKTPGVTVRTREGQTLEVNTDYKVSYRNNVDAGKAMVYVTGIGTYADLCVAGFDIQPLQLDGAPADVRLEGADSLVYTGEPLEPEVAWSSSTTTPTNDGYTGGEINLGQYTDDLTCTYENNVDATTGGQSAYAVISSETGNFEGELRVPFDIKRATLTEDNVTIVAAGPGPLDADAVKVTFGERTLVADTDYTVSTLGTVPGSVAATVTGTGNFQGTVQKKADVLYDIAKADVTVEPAVYNGKAQTPKVEVSYEAGGQKVVVDPSAYDVEVKGDAADAGAYPVTVTGRKYTGWTGSANRDFVVNPATVAAEPQVSYDDAGAYQVTVPGLVEGVDFDVSADPARRELTVTYKGNYTGTAVVGYVPASEPDAPDVPGGSNGSNGLGGSGGSDEPGEPGDPDEPGGSGEPGEPGGPDEPGGSDTLGGSGGSGGSDGSGGSGDTDEPGESGDPDEPGGSGEPGEPGGPDEPGGSDTLGGLGSLGVSGSFGVSGEPGGSCACGCTGEPGGSCACGCPGVPGEPGGSGGPAVPPAPPSGGGWSGSGEDWAYYEDGEPVKGGWRLIGGEWYHFEENGRMTDPQWFQDVDGRWYLLNQSQEGPYGAMLSGWQLVDGEWYYLNERHDGFFGAMLSGWQKVDGEWYYLNTKHDGTFGRMLSGWQLVDGEWYYLNERHDGFFGRMLSGWAKVRGEWYLLNTRHDGTFGRMLTGWQKAGGKWYWMDASGEMASSEWVGPYWVNASGVWTATR